MESPSEKKSGLINIQALVGKLKTSKEKSLERRREEKKLKYEEKKRRERERYYNKKKNLTQPKNEENSLVMMPNSSKCNESKTDDFFNDEKQRSKTKNSIQEEEDRSTTDNINVEKKSFVEKNTMRDHESSKKRVSKKKSNKKTTSIEEIRRREREKKRKYREKLRLNNKKKLEEIQKTDREYQKEKYVPISKKSFKDQISKRKLWRKSKQVERQKKKNAERTEEFLTNNSPPPSRSVTPEIVRQNENALPGQQQNKQNEGEPMVQELYYEPFKNTKPSGNVDAIRKQNDEKSRLLKKVKDLNEKMRLKDHALDLEKSKSERYKKRLQVLRVSYNNKNLKTPSPRTKVNNMIQRGDTKTIKKQLLIGEVLQKQIKKKSESCSKNTEKKFICNVISGNISKKYRVTKYLKGNISYHQYNQSLSVSNLLPAKKVRNNIQLRKKIQEYFTSDLASVQAPGKKDCITSKKNKIQKRYLTDSLANLYKIFKEKYENVSFTTFYKNKPFWVVRQKLESRNTCLCIRHANFSYIFKKMLVIKQISAVSTIDDLGKILCCDVSSDLCLSRMCHLCADKFNGLLTKDADLTTNVSYHKWDTKIDNRIDKNRKEIQVKITTKSLVTSTTEEMINVFEKSLKNLLPHHFRAQHQQEQIKQLQNGINKNEAIINIDFSENYVAKFDEEVQSVHFGGSKKQIALHTGVMHYRHQNGDMECFSFSGVSDDLLHNAFSVWAYLKPVLTLLIEKKINIVHFVSDGPTSQYKNKTNFQLFCYFANYYGIQFSTWNFYEPGHGKSVADGVGGTIKRLADQSVTFGKSITSAQSFIDNVQTNTKIFLYQISTSEINKVIELSSKLSNSSVPNTMKIRQLIWCSTKPKSLILKHKSCLCKTNCDHYLLQPSEFVFENNLQVESTKKPNPAEDSDSDEENLPLSVIQANNCTNPEKKETLCTEIEKGSWLLVTFPTKGPKESFKTLSFICQVSQIFDKKYQGMFLRKKSTRDHQGFVYGFPDVPDEYEFEQANIVRQLSEPEPYGRGLLKFNINTDFC